MLFYQPANILSQNWICLFEDTYTVHFTWKDLNIPVWTRPLKILLFKLKKDSNYTWSITLNALIGVLNLLMLWVSSEVNVAIQFLLQI